MQSACSDDERVNDPLHEISDTEAAVDPAGIDARGFFAVVAPESFPVGCSHARSLSNYYSNHSLMKSFDDTSRFGTERCPVAKSQSRRLLGENTHILCSTHFAVHKIISVRIL